MNHLSLEDHTTEASVVSAITSLGMKPNSIELGDAEVKALAHHPHTVIKSLEHLREAPVRNRYTQVLTTLSGFCAFLGIQKTEKDGKPVVFADRQALTFTGILNHPHTGDNPAWMDRRVKVSRVISRKLSKWKERDGKKMSQEEFALFLEEHIEDIADPSGAEVLSFAETLEATRTETFKSSIVTGTGETKLTYSSERQGEQSSKLITDIKLGVPLFEMGDPYEVKVKIFHRVNDGKLIFWFNLRHLDYLIDKAWAEDFDHVTTEIEDWAEIYEGPAPSEASPVS